MDLGCYAMILLNLSSGRADSVEIVNGFKETMKTSSVDF